MLYEVITPGSQTVKLFLPERRYSGTDKCHLAKHNIWRIFRTEGAVSTTKADLDGDPAGVLLDFV